MKEYENGSNPFSLTFGKKPTEYIIRYENINEIVSAFSDNPSRCQTYLIKGVRGSGKTVLMTAISKELAEKKEWICVDLNASRDLTDDFAYRLSDVYRNVGDVFARGFDLTLAGFGVGIGGSDDRDSISKCERILEIAKQKGQKVLVTIDEVTNDLSMKQFASQFQIWIRKDYPIYLLMTGLYENIDAIQNNPQLTFLLRSPKMTLGPLGSSQIARQYEEVFEMSSEQAISLAKITKGYAFAFQALGMLVWDEPDYSKNDKVIRQLDDLLDDYVYRKIWTGLSGIDKNILLNMPDDKAIKVSDLYTATQITPQSFSKYRERLMNRGLIRAAGHGYVELALPRFGSICKMYE